jgi:ATP-binding cassette subfamily G (WHITE) protein 2 (PDR)
MRDICYSIIAFPAILPKFWVFMYRLSPFSYLVESMVAVGFSDTTVTCAENEYLRFVPPVSLTCQSYMDIYILVAGGYLQDPQAISGCAFCPVEKTGQFLKAVGINPVHSWRDLGIIWIYIVFNIVGALFIYWVIRVQGWGRVRFQDLRSTIR